MGKSPEYPDLEFRAPRSWTPGRPAGQPSLIVIHTTEGSEGTTSAENGAAYDASRTDGTSTHYFHDQDTTVQCVLTRDTAHTAGPTGNRRGIQHELCGRAGQSADQWNDAASAGTLDRAARQCARDVERYGIPLVKLNPTQVANGKRGFCGHADITYAFGEVDHTDPGPRFPWDKFLSMVRAHLEKEKDVQLTDKIGGDTGNAGRTVGDVFRDVAIMREWLIGKFGSAPFPPPEGSTLRNLELVQGIDRRVDELSDAVVRMQATLDMVLAKLTAAK